jgi:uncharacterized membrane protein YhdT
MPHEIASNFQLLLVSYVMRFVVLQTSQLKNLEFSTVPEGFLYSCLSVTILNLFVVTGLTYFCINLTFVDKEIALYSSV